MAEGKRTDVIALFDVDGTLTEPRKVATPEMEQFLIDLRKRIVVGVVGGSDLVKQKEQLGADIVNEVDYSFSENGLVAYHDGKQIHSKTIEDYLGNERLNEFINYTLRYLSDVELPLKRGTFIEFRTGMLNVSPIGRNCSQQERDDFEQYDKEHKVREAMVTALREEFGERFGLTFSIGGQISFDVFPTGWDKTYCLQFLEPRGFKEIHFFGDKTYEGGNDYEIYASEKTIGHSVKSFHETMELCKELFMS